MSTTGSLAGGGKLPRPDDAAEKQRRIAWEAAGIAEARAQLDAGRFVAAEDIDAWIDSIGTAHAVSPPATILPKSKAG